MNCRNEKIGDAKRHTYEYVKQFFKENECQLIESEYTSNSVPLKYKCSCGNVTFSDFQQGSRCMKCSSVTEKLTYDYVKSVFESNNCKLFSTEYKNNSTLLDYGCECGEPAKINLMIFIMDNVVRLVKLQRR
jgi:hypothetical protein